MIEALRLGDKAAQQRFWRERFGEVYAICAHILGSTPQATDVAVDVLTDFITDCVHRLSHDRAAHMYLRLMAVRRSLRRRKELEGCVPVEEQTVVDQDGPSPEDLALLSALRPRLDECLGELTPKAQEVIRLRYTRQMTSEAIGALVGGSKQYIGRLLRRSLELLKQCLEKRTFEKGRGGTK